MGGYVVFTGCVFIAAGIGWALARHQHTCQPPRPTDRVNIQDHCGCVRWVVVGRRVPFRGTPCPAHLVLDEMRRITDAEGQRLRAGRGHWS